MEAIQSSAQTILEENMFWIGGGAILFVALIAIIANRTVSTGHSLMIAIGAAIILTPYIVQFKFGEGGVELTTVHQLTKTAQEAAQGEVEMRRQLASLTEAVKDAADRIATLEANSNIPNPSTGNLEWWPPAADQFLKDNDIETKNVEKRLDTLQNLEKQLAPKL